MEILQYIGITLAVFVTMEGITWLTHKYIMHGLGWYFHEDHHQPGYPHVFEKNDFFFFFSLYPPDYTKRNSRYLKKRHFELCVQYYSEYEMGTSDISNYSDFYRFIISNHEEDFQYLMTNGKVRTLTYQTLLPTIKEAYEFYISK